MAGQSGASFLVSQAGSSIILSSTNPSSHIVANTRTDSAVGGAAANTDLSASAAGYCNPSTAGGSCVYYIAVVSETLPLSSIPPVFQISAQTPSSVTLLPCEAKTQASPDGLRIVGTESIALSPAPSRRYYEVCPSNGDSGKDSSSVFNMSLVVTLEQCSGHTDIFACDTALDADSSSSSSRGGAHCLGSLPTSLDWAYKSNETQTCTRHWIENANMKSGGWSREICTSQVQGQRRPILTLPYRINKDGVSLGGNYYLMVVGAGDYTLTMESGVLGMGATKKSPRLVQITVDGNSGGRVSILSKTKSSYPATVTGPLILSWSPSLLLFPSSSLAVAPRLLQYYAHVVLLDQIQGDSESAARLDTQCGLKKALETYPAGTVKVISLPNPSALSATPDNVVTLELGAQTAMQHIFADNDIPINRKLSITIVAVCNGLCLRRATIESHGAGLCNSSSVDCKPQFFEYTPLVIMSVYSPSSSTRTWFGFLLSMTSWVVLIAILFMVAVGAKIVYERQIAVGSSNVRDDSSSPSTPYVGNWGDSPDGSRGWFSNWGYSKLGFTEMVDTSSFSQVPSSQTLDVGDSTNSNSLGRNGNRGAGKMPIWLHSISERATPFVDRLVAGTRTTGHIISDTASAAFSYMNFSSLNRTSSEGGSEFDKSTYPLNNGSSSGSGNHEQSSSYRPPSPLPFTTQSPSFSISSSIPVSVPTSIAMTDRINRERDPGSGPAYTSLRSQRQFDSRTSDRGGAMLDITAQDEDEEEDEEEEKR